MIEVDHVDALMRKILREREIVGEHQKLTSCMMKQGGVGQPEPNERGLRGKVGGENVLLFELDDPLGEPGEHAPLRMVTNLAGKVADLREDVRGRHDSPEEAHEADQEIEIRGEELDRPLETANLLPVEGADDVEEQQVGVDQHALRTISGDNVVQDHASFRIFIDTTLPVFISTLNTL
jgi:hypothetical protein